MADLPIGFPSPGAAAPTLAPPGSGGGTSDIATQLNIGNQNFSNLMLQLIAAVMGIRSFSGGSFTFPAATSTTIPDSNTTSNSFILLMPLNSAAATMVASGTLSPYISARTAGASFTVSTISGTAAGTEQFGYILMNLP